MKNNLKYIYKKFNNIKYSLLKNLNSRKTKVKSIWNQINSSNKSKPKSPKSKLKNQKISFLNLKSSKVSFPINFNYFSNIKNSLLSKLNNNKFNFKNPQKYSSKDTLRKFLSDNPSINNNFSTSPRVFS